MTNSPRWVATWCRVVLGFRQQDRSITDLFTNAAPDLSDAEQFRSLVTDYLSDHPDIIDAWQAYSEDQRGTPAPYFSGVDVGANDAGDRNAVHHSDRVEACTDFLWRLSVKLAD